jgi:hypothetical protein
MAYSDLGVLLPTESQYGNPGAYTEAIRAEATKQATYLSNMDQFYAQLDESKRQFDMNYSAREKEFSWTSQFQEKKLATETGLAERRLVMEEKQNDLVAQIKQKELQFAETNLGFEKERLGFEKEKLQAELESMRQQIGLKEKEFDLQRELGLGSLDVQRTTAASTSAYQMGQLNLATQTAGFNQQMEAAQLTAELSKLYPQGIRSSEPLNKAAAATGRPSYSYTPVSSMVPQPTISSYSNYTPSYSTSSSGSAVSDYYAKWGK